MVCALLAMLSVTLFSYNHLRGEEEEARAEKLSLEGELQALQENLLLVSDQVENMASILQAWETERENLRTGDRYHLRDPLFEEAKELVASMPPEPSDDLSWPYSPSRLSRLLYGAKENGIRCAFVAVLVENLLNGEERQYSLIGFNTVDEGMVYFEPDTGYRVFPRVGEAYTDCVEGKPYLPNPHTVIKRMVVAW